MKIDISFKNLSKSNLIDEILEKNLSKIEKRLKNFDKDLVHISIHLEKNPNHNEYFCNTCIYLPSKVIKAQTKELDLIKCIDKNFLNLIRQFDKLKSKY